MPHHTPSRRAHSRAGGAAALALAGAAFLPADTATAQGVRYTVQPTASYVWWNDDFGLDRSALYGLRAGADFGTLVGLEGFWLTRGGVGSRFDFLPGGEGDEDGVPNDTDLMNYGLNLRLNFGDGRVAPFVRGGASVFHFRPEGAEDARFLALTWGGGLRFNLTDRLRAQLFAEEAWLRLDRAALQPPGTVPPDPDRDRARRNLTVGAGLGLVLGPPLLEEPRRDAWGLTSLPIEPFVGRLSFDDEALDEQSLAGLRLGLDVGRYVGLRGFYWRGVNSGFSRTEPVQSWGGEAQFNLNYAPILAPYVLLGGGSLDFREGFTDLEGDTRENRTVAILGGGIGLRLTEHFRLNAAVRDYVYTDDAETIDGVSRANELRHNWLYSAGLTFGLGRGNGGGVRVVRETESDSTVLRRIARALEQRDAEQAGRDSAGGAMRDTVWVTERDGELVRLDRRPDLRGERAATDTVTTRDGAAAEPTARQGFVSGRTVTIPVPTEGELYVRYGSPSEAAAAGAAATPANLEAARRAAMQEQAMRDQGMREQMMREQAMRRQMQREQAVRDSAATVRALQSVPMRRDSTGRLAPDTTALREMVRRMIEEERRAAGLDSAARADAARVPDDSTAWEASQWSAASASWSADAPADAAALERRLLARMDAALAERDRRDAERLRALVQQEVRWQVDAAAPARRDLVIGTPERRDLVVGTPAPSTVVVREGAVRDGEVLSATDPRLSTSYWENARTAASERERTRADVDRLRGRVNALAADDTSAAGAREALRLAEMADARAEAAEARTARVAIEAAARAAADSAAADASTRSRRESVARLERLLADVARVQQLDRGLKVVLGDGAFASGQATLTPDARTALGVVVAAIAQHPADTIVIEAHADSTGSAATNLRISRQRAMAVRDALVAHGTPAERILARGLGDQMPVASNGTAAGRAMNRRAELLLVGGPWATSGDDRDRP